MSTRWTILGLMLTVVSIIVWYTASVRIECRQREIEAFQKEHGLAAGEYCDQFNSWQDLPLQEKLDKYLADKRHYQHLQTAGQIGFGMGITLLVSSLVSWGVDRFSWRRWRKVGPGVVTETEKATAPVIVEPEVQSTDRIEAPVQVVTPSSVGEALKEELADMWTSRSDLAVQGPIAVAGKGKVDGEGLRVAGDLAEAEQDAGDGGDEVSAEAGEKGGQESVKSCEKLSAERKGIAVRAGGTAGKAGAEKGEANLSVTVHVTLAACPSQSPCLGLWRP